MMSNIVEVSEETYEQEVLKTDIPVLIDFSAEWCGPCKMLAPIFDSLSNKYNGNVKFIKLDIDSNRTISSKLGIMGVPTIILFKNGKAMSIEQGTEIVDFIMKHLDKKQVFIHCAAGISRSGAIGAFINQITGGFYEEFTRHNPQVHENMYILGLLRKIYNEKVSDSLEGMGTGA